LFVYFEVKLRLIFISVFILPYPTMVGGAHDEELLCIFVLLESRNIPTNLAIVFI